MTLSLQNLAYVNFVSCSVGASNEGPVYTKPARRFVTEMRTEAILQLYTLLPAMVALVEVAPTFVPSTPKAETKDCEWSSY